MKSRDRGVRRGDKNESIKSGSENGGESFFAMEYCPK